MQDLVNNTGSNAAQTMSSREIAELMGKNHYDVMKDVRRMLEKLYEGNTADVLYQQNQALTVEYCPQTKRAACYHLDRYHTEILITGYDVKRRAAVIKRWYELESGEAKPAVAHVQSEQKIDRVQESGNALKMVDQVAAAANLSEADRLLSLADLLEDQLPEVAFMSARIRGMSNQKSKEENKPAIAIQDLPEITATASTTFLLKDRNIAGIDAALMHQLLNEKGIITKTKSAKTGKSCWAITNKGLWYGRNSSEMRTNNPHWYVTRFDHLLDLVGIERQNKH